MMNDSTKKKVLPRLRRIGGQLEGIGRMIEADRYLCGRALAGRISRQPSIR
jgi:DNA-binding FrmR family transcriptional regulator